MSDRTDRRKFLMGAAAAASSAAAQVREIRSAFIGVGVRGGNLLKQTVAQQNVRVTAICDIDPHTRDQALSLASRDNPKSLAEWRVVLDLKDVDAVFIGTPCDQHAEQAAACLEAGKYVYTQAQAEVRVLQGQLPAQILRPGASLNWSPAAGVLATVCNDST